MKLMSLGINRMRIGNHRITCGKRGKIPSQPINSPFTACNHLACLSRHPLGPHLHIQDWAMHTLPSRSQWHSDKCQFSNERGPTRFLRGRFCWQHGNVSAAEPTTWTCEWHIENRVTRTMTINGYGVHLLPCLCNETQNFCSQRNLSNGSKRTHRGVLWENLRSRWCFWWFWLLIWLSIGVTRIRLIAKVYLQLWRWNGQLSGWSRPRRPWSCCC